MLEVFGGVGSAFVWLLWKMCEEGIELTHWRDDEEIDDDGKGFELVRSERGFRFIFPIVVFVAW